MLSESTPKEQERVRLWQNADTANQVYYQQLKQVWDKCRDLGQSSVVDEQAAWGKFQKCISEKTTATLVPFYPWDP